MTFQENDMKFFAGINFVTPAMLALFLLFAPHHASAAAPSAATTLDVCQDLVTGKWVYSGVVSVAGATLRDSSVLAIDYRIENKTSQQGFVDALGAARLDDGTQSSISSTARVTRYAIEAAPLSLGALRSSARIHVSDTLQPTSAPVRLEPRFDLVATVCGCSHPTGCTRTQGYWKSKPGIVWPAPYSRTALFFSSGLTWQQILDTPPQGGNGYLILAHQYIAAVLNRASGASAPAGVQSVIEQARTYFQSGATPGNCGGAACETQKSWAGILDTYNNGAYPGAPKHCPD